jgi:catechol 2,3-dioxygenase-like lactoylglutathione lyase family enzyme
MLVKDINPILNVSNIQESFTWFEKFGWKKLWDWGEPPTFGSVGSGKVCIFLCQNGQGGRGKSTLTTTKDNNSADKGVWMSIWVEDIDAIHRHCLDQGLEVTFPPTNEPWGVREMHVRHPDGHVFRVSQEAEESAADER